MVKPNYAFIKRQKDIARKAKREGKKARKSDQRSPVEEESMGTSAEHVSGGAEESQNSRGSG